MMSPSVSVDTDAAVAAARAAGGSWREIADALGNRRSHNVARKYGPLPAGPRDVDALADQLAVLRSAPRPAAEHVDPGAALAELRTAQEAAAAGQPPDIRTAVRVARHVGATWREIAGVVGRHANERTTAVVYGRSPAGPRNEQAVAEALALLGQVAPTEPSTGAHPVPLTADQVAALAAIRAAVKTSTRLADLEKEQVERAYSLGATWGQIAKARGAAEASTAKRFGPLPPGPKDAAGLGEVRRARSGALAALTRTQAKMEAAKDGEVGAVGAARRVEVPWREIAAATGQSEPNAVIKYRPLIKTLDDPAA